MKDQLLSNVLPAGTRLTSPSHTYTLQKHLGIGGFGITYRADVKATFGNIQTTIPVAIKEFFPSSLCERVSGTSAMSYSNPIKGQVENARRDFLGESKRLNSLAGKHPNIVTVNEVFETNNTAYYVMEYLEGQTLAELVKSQGKLSEEQTLQIMVPIVDAVAFLHSQRITHLDIKPANIMIVAQSDGSLRPVLIDFGLSKHYNEDGSATSTINTSGYSEGFAPREQYRGIQTFSPVSDVYSLGATILFCLTGKPLASSLDLTENDIAESIPNNTSPARAPSTAWRPCPALVKPNF